MLLAEQDEKTNDPQQLAVRCDKSPAMAGGCFCGVKRRQKITVVMPFAVALPIFTPLSRDIKWRCFNLFMSLEEITPAPCAFFRRCQANHGMVNLMPLPSGYD